ncbi:MAG: hypothetical protein NC827_09695 [Candidatus Omnitrophica bacterium]|nr:hypothetical protein [Candidatus Omnitrophota bacterium]
MFLIILKNMSSSGRHYNLSEWMGETRLLYLLPRKLSLKILEELLLPIPNVKVVDGDSLEWDKNEIENFIRENSPCILSTHSLKPEKTTKCHCFLDICSYSDFVEKIQSIDGIENYEIILSETIRGVEDGYVGIAISGEGLLLTEYYVEENCEEINKLTDGSDPSRLDHLFIRDSTIKYLPNRVPSRDVEKLVKYVYGKRGYFEFIKGRGHKGVDIYFIDFQDDDSMLHLKEIRDIKFPSKREMHIPLEWYLQYL